MAGDAWGQAEEQRVEGTLAKLNWVVESVARKWSGAVDSDTLEDLRQEARLGVWKAIVTHDCHRGTKLSTYAYRCAEHRVLDVMRSLRRDHDFIVTLEETVAEATAHEAECGAGNGGAGEWTLERFLACLTREDLCAAYQQLNRREQAIIAWSFGGGETNARIAARLGENVEAIKKARQRAIHQMAGEAAGADGRGARSGNSPAHGGVRAAA